MTTNKSLSILCCLASGVMVGCASTEVTEKIERKYTDSAAKIEVMKQSLSNRPIVLPEQPFPYLGTKSAPVTDSTEELPRVFRGKTAVKFKQKAMTAGEFARLITEETGVPVKLHADSANTQFIKIEGKVTQRTVELSTLPAMELKQLLNIVAPQFGVDWDYYDGALHLESTFRKSYQISFAPTISKQNLHLGKSSNGQSGATGSNAGLSGNFNSIIDSSVDGEINPVKDVEDTLIAMAGGKENVTVNKSIGLATVNCSKDCHKNVSKFVEQANFLLTQQVLLRVNIITVSSTASGQSGIDWNLIYQNAVASGRGYNFLFGSPQSLVKSGAGIITSSIVTPAGKKPQLFDGSNMLFKAISEASKVVENKPFDLVTQNNESVTLSNLDQQAFTESTQVVPTGVGGTPVYSTKLGYATYGQLIQITPTILPSGKIIVRFGIDDTKVKNFVAAASQGETDKLTLGGLKFATKATLKVGSTWVLSGYKVTQSNADDAGLFARQTFGSSAGKDNSTETIILITPYLSGN